MDLIYRILWKIWFGTLKISRLWRRVYKTLFNLISFIMRLLTKNGILTSKKNYIKKSNNWKFEKLTIWI